MVARPGGAASTAGASVLVADPGRSRRPRRPPGRRRHRRGARRLRPRAARSGGPRRRRRRRPATRVIENVHRDGILRSPAGARAGPAGAAGRGRSHRHRLARRPRLRRRAGRRAVRHGGRPLANELAPRVHNSGHWTIEGAVTSQFDQHLRAVPACRWADQRRRAPRDGELHRRPTERRRRARRRPARTSTTTARRPAPAARSATSPWSRPTPPSSLGDLPQLPFLPPPPVLATAMSITCQGTLGEGVEDPPGLLDDVLLGEREHEAVITLSSGVTLRIASPGKRRHEVPTRSSRRARTSRWTCPSLMPLVVELLQRDDAVLLEGSADDRLGHLHVQDVCPSKPRRSEGWSPISHGCSLTPARSRARSGCLLERAQGDSAARTVRRSRLSTGRFVQTLWSDTILPSRMTKRWRASWSREARGAGPRCGCSRGPSRARVGEVGRRRLQRAPAHLERGSGDGGDGLEPAMLAGDPRAARDRPDAVVGPEREEGLEVGGDPDSPRPSWARWSASSAMSSTSCSEARVRPWC